MKHKQSTVKLLQITNFPLFNTYSYFLHFHHIHFTGVKLIFILQMRLVIQFTILLHKQTIQQQRQQQQQHVLTLYLNVFPRNNNHKYFRGLSSVNKKKTHVYGEKSKCILCRHICHGVMAWKKEQRKSQNWNILYEQNKRGGFSMQKRCRVICRLKHENLIMIIILQ